MDNTDKVISTFFENEEVNSDKHSGHRDRAYYRNVRRKSIARKKKKSKIYYGGWTPEHDGYLAKGKVHCSCWMCAFHGIPIQDLKRIEAMDESLKNMAEEIA